MRIFVATLQRNFFINVCGVIPHRCVVLHQQYRCRAIFCTANDYSVSTTGTFSCDALDNKNGNKPDSIEFLRG